MMQIYDLVLLLFFNYTFGNFKKQIMESILKHCLLFELDVA